VVPFHGVVRGMEGEWGGGGGQRRSRENVGGGGGMCEFRKPWAASCHKVRQGM
jgi:hypothetical protein